MFVCVCERVCIYNIWDMIEKSSNPNYRKSYQIKINTVLGFPFFNFEEIIVICSTQRKFFVP